MTAVSGEAPLATTLTGVILKQTSLVNRLCNTLRRGLGLACCSLRLRGRACRRCRPIGIGCCAHAPIRELDLEPRGRADGIRGMHGMSGFIAHQRKAAGEHAAIGQSGKQLAAVLYARIEPLQQRRQRALGALGEPMGALALAENRVALCLRVGKF